MSDMNRAYPEAIRCVTTVLGGPALFDDLDFDVDLRALCKALTTVACTIALEATPSGQSALDIVRRVALMLPRDDGGSTS